ncbi:glycosyl transferase family 4 [Candidatus Pacearchaeota archaeon]|nr:glycosyl transferase family 4 [Candidatus Pacearchaeota archaeon]
MEYLLFISVLVSFVLTALALPKWIKKCRQVGLLWEDMNKINKAKRVAASGGIIVVIAFVLGVLSYIAIRTFIFQGDGVNLEIFALLNVILILALVGFVDDILGWTFRGLSARFRLFLAFTASIPLVVINAGASKISVPFFGLVELGIIYPLIFIPIGIAGATTTYNFLAGFNGLEAGQGIIIISFLSFIAYLTGNSWLSIVGLCMVGSLFVFYFYNSYPAKVFPGDVMTYSIGALIAGMAILGNFEKIAVFCFIPYIIETFLKARGRLKKQSFGRVNDDGSLDIPYPRIYGITHLSIFILKKLKKKVYEIDVVYLIFLFQIIICFLALWIFKEGMF